MITEGQFPFKRRGELRDDMLATMRVGLLRRTNPVTLAPFSVDEANLATAPHGEYFIRADAIDAVLMLSQGRGEWLLAQLDPETAGTGALDGLWGKMYAFPRLKASGGTGPVSSPCPALTHFAGSTVLGDPAAVVGADANGKKYQVLFSVTSPADGSAAELEVIGIDTGFETNLAPGMLIKWANAPDTVTQPATVISKFTGGNPDEGDRDYAKRFIRRVRYKPGAGNNAMYREWMEDSLSNAIEVGFVYACASYSGTSIGVIVQKRGGVLGPLARVPAAGTLAIARAYIATVAPTPPMIWLLAFVPIPSDFVLSLSMPVGSPAGFVDFQPWPSQSGGTAPLISALTNQTHFQVTSLVALPSGVTAPAMMAWNALTSRFSVLTVGSVTLSSGNIYDVVLAVPPADMTLAVGTWVSPTASSPDVIAEAIESYFDSLGPGELVAPGDNREHRAARFPKQQDEYPQRAGIGVLTFLGDALGASLIDAQLNTVGVGIPPIPADVLTGPGLLVAGKVSISSY